MELSVEKLTLQLPHYLTAPRREGIQRALSEFPEIRFFYLNAYQNEVLQGDAWSQLTALNFSDGAKKKIRGVVLSNSCEVDPANHSPLFPQLIFVPLLRVNTVSEFLRRRGHAEDRVINTVTAIRKQEVDRFFYFPAGAGLGDESVAWLDQVHTMPLSAFTAEPEKQKLATLADASFYLFAFKLSIYFCRLHENVDRSATAEER
jgi:hypothetical protein